MAEGWIKLYRTIQDHWIWNDPQKLKWWLDILLLANHKENKFLLGNELITLERGEHHTSELKLAERWGVSKTTVRKFIKLLESDGMIKLKKSKKGTTLKVSNYKDYQDFSEEEKTVKKPQKNHKKTIEEPQKNHEVYTNNNEKNEKNDKNDNNEKNTYSGNPELNKCILQFIKMRKSIKKPMTDDAIKLMLGKLNKMAANNYEKIEILNQSIMNSWQGIFPLKQATQQSDKPTIYNNHKQKEYDIKSIERKLLGWDEGE